MRESNIDLQDIQYRDNQKLVPRLRESRVPAPSPRGASSRNLGATFQSILVVVTLCTDPISSCNIERPTAPSPLISGDHVLSLMCVRSFALPSLMGAKRTSLRKLIKFVGNQQVPNMTTIETQSLQRGEGKTMRNQFVQGCVSQFPVGH